MSERRIEPSVTMKPRTVRIIVFAFLILIGGLLFSSVRQESQTFDEGDHIFSGFEYWKHADFGRNPEHPPLVKLLAAAPLLSMGLKEPPPIPIPFFKLQDFLNASQFLYSADADAILIRSRMVVALFSLALAMLVFCAAREMFDQLTGILALGLFAFEPVLLANGALVTTDMPLSCLFFASVYSFYRYTRKPSISRLLLCTIATGLTLVAKHSGVLIFPVLILLAVADLWIFPRQASFGTVIPARDRKRRFKQLVYVLAAAMFVSYVFLWAIYGFRYAARPGQLQIAPPLAAYTTGLSSHLKQAIITFLAQHHLFPEAYLYGWVDILRIPGTRNTFLFGHVFATGKWFFFPAVFLVKTTLTLLIFLLMVPFARIRNHRRELLFLIIPVAFYLAVSIASMLNLGIRHVLPIYPFCIVLGAAAASSLVVRSGVTKITIPALLMLTVISSLHSFPNYLAYSNEVAGGPSHTYQLVSDSSVDWGQGLKWAKTYIDQHSVSSCWFDYYNPAVPLDYYGIPCKRLLTGLGHIAGVGTAPIPTTISGTVLVSASELVGLMWGPDKLNPYQVFYERRPDAVIGNTIFVYSGTFDVHLLAAQTNAIAATNLLQQHRIPEAVELAKTAVQQAPDSVEVNVVLGQTLLAANRMEEGQEVLANAIQMAQSIHPEFQKTMIDQKLLLAKIQRPPSGH